MVPSQCNWRTSLEGQKTRFKPLSVLSKSVAKLFALAFANQTVPCAAVLARGEPGVTAEAPED